MPIFKKKFGFTLAEVLITLGIIGVVAAMTIPTLMNNVQDKELHTAAKKAFSVLSQATEKIIYENSGSLWDNSSADSTVLSKSMADEYAKYLSVVKEDFIENIQKTDWLGYKSSTNTNAATSGGTRYALLLKDGMIFRFNASQNCKDSLSTGKVFCGGVVIDVNGSKPPNMAARDVYQFYIIKDSTSSTTYKVVPNGVDIDGTACGTGVAGFECTENVMTDMSLP